MASAPPRRRHPRRVTVAVTVVVCRVRLPRWCILVVSGLRLREAHVAVVIVVVTRLWRRELLPVVVWRARHLVVAVVGTSKAVGMAPHRQRRRCRRQ